MEKYEFDEEWAALEPFEKLDPAGSTSLLSGRVLLGVTASADAQMWTSELDSLLGDWVWSMIQVYQEELSDIWDAYKVFSDLVEDSMMSPTVQEKLVRLISYLMNNSGPAQDHCINLLTGLEFSYGEMGNEFFHAMKSMYAGNQWRMHIAKALAWEFDKHLDSIPHQMLEWIMSAPGAGASLNGQIDSSNDGIKDNFGWGLCFGPELITDCDRIMDAFIEVLKSVDRAVDSMRSTAHGGYWKDFYTNAHTGWERGWTDIESALTGLYTAVDKVAGNGYKPWPEPEVQGKLAVLTPAQVMASIFGADVVIRSEHDNHRTQGLD